MGKGIGGLSKSTNTRIHSKNMRVGIVCPASLPATQFGGIVSLALDIAKEVNKSGHKATIYTTDLDFTKSGNSFNKDLPVVEKCEGVEIKRAHVYARIKLFFINPGIYNMIKNDSPDIMHTVGIRGFQSIIAMIISRRHKIPLVISDQGGLDTHPNAKHGLLRIIYIFQKPLIRAIIRHASRIIAANAYEKKIFSRYCDPSKITVIQNGVDVDKILSCPFDFKERYKIPKYLLFVGRLAHVKGPDILLRSIKQLKDADSLLHHKVVIMGSNFGYEEKIRQMINDLELENDVLVIKDPIREEVIAAYHGCEFLILPSRWEMSPLTPIEGFICKKTSISTRAHGIPYVIKDGENGLLFEPEDHAGLAEKIAHLLKNHNMREKMAEKGHEEYVKKCTRDGMGKKIIKVYEEVIGQAARPEV